MRVKKDLASLKPLEARRHEHKGAVCAPQTRTSHIQTHPPSTTPTLLITITHRDALVRGRAAGNAGLQLPSVADHVWVGEVAPDDVVLAAQDGLLDLFRDLVRLHLGLLVERDVLV